jgi:hypothetical protein
MKTVSLVRALSIAVVVAAAGGAAADEPKPTRPVVPGALTLATERVVVFKDGFALFVKRAQGTADADGRVFTEKVPDAAVLGTFWASAAEGKILGMHAGWSQRDEPSEPATTVTMAEILRANVGKEVVLGFVRENAPSLSATVVQVLERWPASPPPLAELDPRSGVVPPGEPQGGAFVVVRPTGRDENHVLPVGEIRTVSGAGLSTTTAQPARTVRTKRLTFDLGPEAAGKPATLRLFYFRPGLRWIPTYRLSGDFQAKGDLALQAEVMNEAEDVDGAALDLVVGVPNFRYREVVSPLVLEAAMRQVFAQDERAGQILTQNVVSNRFSNEFRAEAGPAEDGAEALRMAPELAAAQGQDLFVYRAPRLSLKRGERATFALWQVGVPLRHVYTYDVSLPREASTGGRRPASRDRASPLRMTRNDVWHQVEIPNGTETPWTTGAILLMQGDLPLGQEMLGYTARGSRTLVPVTVAVDVQGRVDERELERRPNAVNVGGHMFTLVRKRIDVTVTNRRQERSDVRISVATGGRASAASEGGRVVLDDFHPEDWPDGGHAVNNHSDVTWDVALEPGKTATFTCEVEFLLY